VDVLKVNVSGHKLILKMDPNLEETIQKLDWEEFEYNFNFKIDSNLCITLSNKLENEIPSCALGLRSNNEIYAIFLNRFHMDKLILNSILDQEHYFFTASIEDREPKPIKLLSKLSPEKVQEFKDVYLDYIEEVREKDVREMSIFTEKYREFQKERELYNRTHITDSIGITNIFRVALLQLFSFGKYKKSLQLYLKWVTEKAIAWLVLEQTAKNCADDLSKYAKSYKQTNHKEIAEQVDEISGFYRNLAYHAHFGGERTRVFQDEVFDIYSLDSSELKQHNIEEVKKTILDKINV
jgi:hypothetical protein